MHNTGHHWSIGSENGVLLQTKEAFCVIFFASRHELQGSLHGMFVGTLRCTKGHRY